MQSKSTGTAAGGNKSLIDRIGKKATTVGLYTLPNQEAKFSVQTEVPPEEGKPTVKSHCKSTLGIG